MLVLWAVMTASGCSGCDSAAASEPGNAPARQEPEKVLLDSPLEPEFLRMDHRLIELAGEPDFNNRYLTAVKVTAMEGEEERMWCGGAVISPWVVLTAGHCVCGLRRSEQPNETGETTLTGAACYDMAQIETLVYGPYRDWLRESIQREASLSRPGSNSP